MTKVFQRLIGGLAFFLAIGLSAACPAQDRGDEPLAYRQQRLARAEASLSYLDTNHNGQIDIEEVQSSRQRSTLAKYLQRTGVSPNFPIPISLFRPGLLDYYHLTADQVGSSTTTSTTTSTTPASSGTATTSVTSSATSSTTAGAPLVPGFGVSETITPPPGFGVGTDASASPTAVASVSSVVVSGTSSTASSSSSTSSASTSSGPPLDEKIRQYAAQLLQMYDTNKDGVLDRDEGKSLRHVNFTSADTNHDGKLTVDEIAAYLISRSGSSRSSSSSATAYSSRWSTGTSSSSWKSPSSGSVSTRAAASDAPRKGIRFLTPAERLPSGLPDWFLAKDTNGDGQISMAEFAKTWSEATAKEFLSYDLNGDGVITPAEVMAKIAADPAAADLSDQASERKSSRSSGHRPK